MSNPSACFVIILLEWERGAYPYAIGPDLERRGYTVIYVNTAQAALDHIRLSNPALVVLDCSAGHGSHVELCQSWRAEKSDLPILMIISADACPEVDLLANMNVSVLAQPFTSRKLLNRVKRLLPQPDGDILCIGNVTLYLQRRCLKRGNVEYRLTPMKMRLMEAFMRHPGETLSRRFLLKEVWETDYVGDTRTLDVHIRWLRQIVEDDPGRPCCLTTVRGVGYRFTPDASE